jgi:hypothetical protein
MYRIAHRQNDRHSVTIAMAIVIRQLIPTHKDYCMCFNSDGYYSGKFDSMHRIYLQSLYSLFL